MRAPDLFDGPRWIAASVFAAAILLMAGMAGAQDERPRAKPSVTQTPVPRSRPANLTSVPDPAKTPASIPAAPPRKAVASVAEPPHDLPVATRARMHECGAEWQRMKLSGDAADKIWRVFAQGCLVSQMP